MTTTRIPRSIAAGLTAAIAAAGLASTASAAPVPEGKIEHTVRTVTVSGTKASHQRAERQELYLAANRARMVVRDQRTGKLISETTFADGRTTFYDAAAKTLDRLPGRETTPPWNSLSDEAEAFRKAFDEGKAAQVGETTVDGRAALQLQSVAGKWTSDIASSVTRLVVDEETFVPFSIVSSPGPEFTQQVDLVKTETLDRTKANERLLAMAKHVVKAKKAKKAKKGAAKR